MTQADIDRICRALGRGDQNFGSDLIAQVRILLETLLEKGVIG